MSPDTLDQILKRFSLEGNVTDGTGASQPWSAKSGCPA
jgi:hypothetical protein